MKYLPAGTFEMARATGWTSLLTMTSEMCLPPVDAAYTPKTFALWFARLTWMLELPNSVPYL